MSLGTIIIFVGSYLIEKLRINEKSRGLVQFFALMPMAVPGLVLGLAYIFFFNAKDFIAISKASVPLPSVTQNLEPTNLLKLFSNFKTSFPPTKFELLINLIIFFRISFLFDTNPNKFVNLIFIPLFQCV